MSETVREYTLLEALAELNAFNPKKKIGQEIIFEITDPADAETDNAGDFLRIGKHWSKYKHGWVYFEHQKNCPCLVDEEQHFISNFMCTTFAKRCMLYGAQQGTYVIRKITDTREKVKVV